MKAKQPRLRKQPGLFCLHSVMADAVGGQRVEEFIEQDEREKRDEQRLNDFRRRIPLRVGLGNRPHSSAKTGI